ncbi:MAG: Mut7-C RNAse domain-containing protein [Anaerolineae bacterium]
MVEHPEGNSSAQAMVATGANGEEGSVVKFLADEMLGKLAKWLRLMGYDTLYLSPADDHQLARLARAEGRVLLTRDTQLAARRGLDSLFIESDNPQEQLRQVFTDLSLTTFHPFSRCPICNASLEEVDTAALEDRIPLYVLRTQDQFRLCPQCGRVYWRGSHWQKMSQMIQSLLPLQNQDFI